MERKDIISLYNSDWDLKNLFKIESTIMKRNITTIISSKKGKSKVIDSIEWSIKNTRKTVPSLPIEVESLVKEKIIDFVISDSNYNRIFKAVHFHKYISPNIENELKLRMREEEKKVLEKLVDCFTGFDIDTNSKTTFEITFPQFSQWKWWNECRKFQKNPIRLDTMFEFFKVDLDRSENKYKNSEKNVTGCFIERSLLKLERIFDLEKEYLEQLTFFVDYMNEYEYEVMSDDFYEGMYLTLKHKYKTHLTFYSKKLQSYDSVKNKYYGLENLKYKKI